MDDVRPLSWPEIDLDLKLIIVRKLAVNDKLTAAKIAKKVGVHRSAIIQLCGQHDIKLPGRSVKDRAARTAARKPKIVKPVVVKTSKIALLPKVRAVPVVERRNVSFWKLKRGMCHFPLWGNQRVTINQKFYCGLPTMEGERFCAHCSSHVKTSEGEADVAIYSDGFLSQISVEFLKVVGSK